MAIQPRKVYRVLVYTVGAVAAVGAVYILFRYRTEKVPAGYTCLSPEVEPGSTVLVDRLFDLSGELAVGQMVRFRLARGGESVPRYGRVAAVPGTRMELRDGGFLLDGVDRGFPTPRGVTLPGEVSEGEVLLAYNAAITEDGGGTLETALVREDDVECRVLMALWRR
ncbi:MAG: hypothetical protein HY720_24140 [Planctomycetes bacterium]|nr:hypothetical protein [Planctomycetota bacterium]